MACGAAAGHFRFMKLAYTINEAVKATGIGRTTLYGLIKSGQIEIVKLGTRTLIKAPALQQFINHL